MKRITTIFLGLLLTSSLTATAASAQNTPNPPLSPRTCHQIGADLV
jgi:Spy/CpxP family protein refolding chaperone